MKRLRSKLTYANVVATLALFVALAGGTAFAAEQVLPKNSVGSKQIKEGAVTTSKLGSRAVTGAKIAPGSISGADVNSSTLGTVPSATHAGTADAATTAADSARLGGVAPGEFARTAAQSGEVLTGQVDAYYVPNPLTLTIGAASFRSPLPPSTPMPTLVYTTSTTAQCPGFGQAASGILCIYAYNVDNIKEVGLAGGGDGDNRLFGFELLLDTVESTKVGFMMASWAYRVP